MQTTKLYSEILEKVNSFGDVICKDENGKDCEAIDDFKYPELAQSIEQLVINRLENFYDWVITSDEHFKNETDKIWNSIVRSEDEKERKILITKELIQLYLNK